MPAIKKPNQHFDVTTYVANGADQRAITNSGSMPPDLVIIRNRSRISEFMVFDSVRGAGKILQTQAVDIEGTNATSLESFNSNGFTVGSSINWYVNYPSNDNIVAWQWRAGGTAVTNNDGTITSQVSANPTAGFSVVSWTGNGSTSATVGHGLGATPAMIICKERSGTDYWHVKHKNLTSTYNLFLNTTLPQTSAASVGDGVLGDLSSSTTFGFATAGSPGNVVAVNENGVTNIAYCWSEVAGFSKFGTYTGNGSTDGPFVYLGFRPKFFMVKRIDTNGLQWEIFDSARFTYNGMNNPTLYPNATTAENSDAENYGDFLSNGFKLRYTNGNFNASNGTYIYAAFAENPFKYASAR